MSEHREVSDKNWEHSVSKQSDFRALGNEGVQGHVPPYMYVGINKYELPQNHAYKFI